jgi:hypothetical protein
MQDTQQAGGRAGRPVSVYLDQRTLEALDREVAARARRGETASRSALLRVLVVAALLDRGEGR